MGVFSWSEQPEEAADAEVADDLVEDTPDGVLEVEGGVEGTEDGDIGGVGAVGGFVFLRMADTKSLSMVRKEPSACFRDLADPGR